MPHFSLQQVVKQVLKNYVEDKNTHPQKANTVFVPATMHEKTLPKSAQFHIYLNEGQDDKVIEWLEKIPKGCRNSMIKNMTRSYFDFPVIIPYEMLANNTDTDISSDDNVRVADKILGDNTKPQKIQKSQNNVTQTPQENIATETTSKKENKIEQNVATNRPSDDEIRKVLETANIPTNNTSTENKTDDVTEDDSAFDDFEKMLNNF